LSTGGSDQRAQFVLHLRQPDLEPGASPSRLELPDGPLRRGQAGQALARHQAERRAVDQPGVPHVHQNSQRVDQLVVGRRWRRRGSCDLRSSRAEPLEVPSVGRKREPVSRVRDMLAQMPHQGDLALSLFEEDG
jgi:hypothetical protein